MKRRAWSLTSTLLLAGLAFACAPRVHRPAEEARLVLEPATFDDLPGWSNDPMAPALDAFRRSCAKMATLPPETPLGGSGFAGTAGDWRTACEAAQKVPAGNAAAARGYFETWFQPLAAHAEGGEGGEGLFTGYYEALLNGSRTRTERYNVPLYGRPTDLVSVDLGLFREDLKGRRIAGRVEDGKLVPYADRQTIEQGALAGRDLELVWVDDPVDAFFLQIQGSGRVRLAEGGEMRIGYAGENGHPYYAIGRELVKRGALKKEEVSMQSIRRWLEEHPQEAPGVLATNASYVFFQEIEGEGPLGAEGVPLTPERSLAVDRKHWPLGVPLWLDTMAPAAQENAPDRPLRRLVIAQDTGGAIRGPIRGDVFWGVGDEAASIAGRMKHAGRLWVLVPRTLTPGPSPTSGRGV
ncbi:MAG TPA: MltA domain-containing protein [Thermoanaerobaculia bacterium]|nr:MltA domain-containing protein [Thermoanaerobaculia bacterium]